MNEIHCIFEGIFLKDQDTICEKYVELIKEINKNSKIYNKEEMKKYFKFDPPEFINNIFECKIDFFNNYYNATLAYSKNGELLDKEYCITKYEFILENKTYLCYESSFLLNFFDKKYTKKKFI